MLDKNWHWFNRYRATDGNDVWGGRSHLRFTDGQTNRGLSFGKIDRVVEGLQIPVYTIGFEADIEDLGRVSALVEAASLNAGEENLRYKIGSLLNSQM